MLTATYILLSLSAEQKKVHQLLSSAQQLFHNNCTSRQRPDPVALETVVSQLDKLDASCHRRKVEVYVIPAIQQTTNEADHILAELEALSTMGLRTLATVKERVRLAFEQSAIEINSLYAAIELYCNNLLARLAKEEEELLPLAQRVISSDGWFAIGAQFLLLEEENKRHA
jgi:hemerythrin-like domain-containing protein